MNAVNKYNNFFIKNILECAKKEILFRISPNYCDRLSQDIDKLAIRTIASVLGDEGLEAFLSKETKKIQFINLKSKIEDKLKQSKKNLKTLKAKESVYKLLCKISREKKSQSREEVIADFYQVMGTELPYADWQEGTIIQSPYPKEVPDYIVDQKITNNRGLHIVVLVPKEGQTGPPLLCCRGTTYDLDTVVDDFPKEKIGQRSFSSSRLAIQEILEQLVKKHGPAVVLGHSLGGAIAQRITADCSYSMNENPKLLIKECRHFNAPGIGKETAKQFTRCVKDRGSNERPIVYSYRHVNDFLSLAGGNHITADEQYELGKFTSIRRIEVMRDAHSITNLLSKYMRKGQVKWRAKKTLKQRLFQVFAEKVGTRGGFLVNHIVMRAFQQKAREYKLLKRVERLDGIMRSLGIIS